MITSINTDKASYKIQYPFMIKKKTVSKVGIVGIYQNIIKVIYNILTANVIFNGVKNGKDLSVLKVIV